jgi:hypothetical protein
MKKNFKSPYDLISFITLLIIFFTGTYASAGDVSNVGIYVGGGYMIDAGSPISYVDTPSP